MTYSTDLIIKYFPDLTPRQIEQFAALEELYRTWNAAINVISRKDFDALYLHHVLHSLAIAAVCRFDEGARLLDIGCGGGFPSVPLAIMFPSVHITAVDSIGKKIKVVKGVCEGAGITNVTAENCRVEALDGHFDYVVSRAVADMRELVGWTWNKLQRGTHGTLPNGMICLKGGSLAEELALTGKRWTLTPVRQLFDEEYFDQKFVVYTPR